MRMPVWNWLALQPGGGRESGRAGLSRMTIARRKFIDGIVLLIKEGAPTEKIPWDQRSNR